MTGRNWLRKDVILPILYLIVFGVILYLLFSLAERIPAEIGSDIVRFGRFVLLLLYALLAFITFRHALSTYDLERYDPGDPRSLQRLMRRRRFRAGHHPPDEERLMTAIEQTLLDRKFRLECESHLIGRIYARYHPPGFLRRATTDRIILLQHEPLTVFAVDRLFQDVIRYVRSNEQPSGRNVLILLSRMAETQDAASAAAGFVNFLGKFKGGTLCPMLLATRQNRLFYPADRTLMPRSHRLFQNRLLRHVRRLIFESSQTDNKKGQSAKMPANSGGEP